jgi:hypothetical protein
MPLTPLPGMDAALPGMDAALACQAGFGLTHSFRPSAEEV